MSESTDVSQLNLKVGNELSPESKFYFNGFTVGISPMDCSIVLLLNNRPVAYLHTTHTIAKSLAVAIEGLVKDFEDKTGQQILKLDEITALLQKDAS